MALSASPKLNQSLPPDSGEDVLFLHDLAISRKLARRGVGRQFAQAMLDSVIAHGKRKALLVSIQASMGFWSKPGFRALTGSPGASYENRAARLMPMNPPESPPAAAPWHSSHRL